MCDVVVGLPVAHDKLLRTSPYYRSAYAFVTLRDGGVAVRSFDDSVLRHLRIGVQVISDDGADTPPAFILAKRGLGAQVRSFIVPDEHATPGAPPAILAALVRKEIDVAVMWGPLAGYWAQRSALPIRLASAMPVRDLPFLPCAFDIAMGVRSDHPQLRNAIDSILVRRHREIAGILDAYGVPREAEGRSR
jgi:mxaJ protein